MKKFYAEYGPNNFYTAINIAENVCDYMNAGEYDEDCLDSAIYDEIDRQLIYNHECWVIMMEYQNPREANFNDAVDELINEVYSIIEEEEIDDEEGGEE